MNIPLPHPPRTARTYLSQASYAEALDPLFVVETNVDVPNWLRATETGAMSEADAATVRQLTADLSDFLPDYIVTWSEWIGPRTIIVAVTDPETGNAPPKEKWQDIADSMLGNLVDAAQKIESADYYELKYGSGELKKGLTKTVAGVPIWAMIAGVGVLGVGLILASKPKRKKRR